MRDAKLSELVGRVLASAENIDNETIRFTTDRGEVYELYHDQACCESVRVEDVTGNLADLVAAPITLADESSSKERPSDLPASEYEPESQTWTFYRFATVRGYVNIRWFGSSNGYYSEGVSFRTDASALPSEDA